MSATLRYYAVPATVSLAVIVTFVAVTLMASSGAAVAAKQPTCGDRITQDTTLRKDLVSCPNNGIRIGADGVTLDLNGHTINGDGTPAAHCNPRKRFCDVGVVNNGHDGVTVRQGSVREFAIGMVVLGARKNQITNISSSRHTLFGLVLGDAARSVVQNGSFSRNIAPDGDGIGVFASDHLKIFHNRITRNPGPGIHVDGSNDNLVKRNVFSRNSPAILMAGNRNVVRRNRCDRNDACVLVSPGSRNVIARNHIHKGGDGIAIEEGHDNLVARNEIVGPGKAGVYLAIRHPLIGGVDNVIRRNLVRGSRRDGFRVRKADRHSVLKRNIAIGAEDDGFRVNSRTAKLTDNQAKRNGDLGIEAILGVIDGGGNVARHNGDPRQCRHIACG